jgi:L-asparaginase
MAELELKSKKSVDYKIKYGPKKILIISTGGTFNCVQTEEGLKPEFNEKKLRESLSPVTSECELTFENLFLIDSCNIVPKHWKLISECINKHYKTKDGIIIIHGTDTLAYTSAMLSHMLRGIPIPVILTGSQLSIVNPVADALENMRVAIYMAKNNYPGVYVVFNRKIMLGNCVSKTHSKSFNAFESINIGNVAEVNAYGIIIDEKLIPEVDPFFRVRNNFCDKVFLLKLTPGLDPDIIDYLIEKEYKGIIIESYGLGGLPNEEGNDFVNKCKLAIDKGIKIIVLSQCTYDGVDLSVYETGMKTKEMGIINMPLATKEYAYTRLMWELGNN